MFSSKRIRNQLWRRPCGKNGMFIIILSGWVLSFVSLRLENLLSSFETTRRYEVFTDDRYRETLQENSNLVDHNETLQRQLGQAQEEIMALKHTLFRQSDRQSGAGISRTSAFIGPDGRVPIECPLGGCSHYETVHRGPDVSKNFQNHMNNTHRVCGVIERFSVFCYL